MPKKGECVRCKSCGRNIKSLFMIFADFECIFVPEDNGKQNPNRVLYKQILKTCCL